MDTEARKAVVRPLIKAVIEGGKDIEAAVKAIVEAWEVELDDTRQEALTDGYTNGWINGQESGRES